MGLSIEEYWSQYSGTPTELINGQVVRLPQKGYIHEVVTSRVHMCLSVFVEARYMGEIFGQGARFALSKSDLRAPDVAFVSYDLLEDIHDPEAYLPFAPVMMVEVISPRYTSREIQAKVDAFLNAGTQLIWVVDPDQKLVTVFFPDGTTKERQESDPLEGYHLLPDLNLTTDDLFPPISTQMRLY